MSDIHSCVTYFLKKIKGLQKQALLMAESNECCSNLNTCPAFEKTYKFADSK